MQKNNFNIIIVGVGGQGLITLTQILAEAALIEGLDVKTSELHGLAQRGGSVETHIRFGKKTWSPLIDYGKADLIIGLEIQEGLRAIYFANPKTAFLVNDNYIFYYGGLQKEVIDKKIKEALGKKLYLIPASKICQEKLEKEVVSGVYLLGHAVYHNLLPLKLKSLLKAISKVIPEKYLELNQRAFNLAKTSKI